MTVPAAFKLLLLAGLLAEVFTEDFEANAAQKSEEDVAKSERDEAEARLFHEQAENAAYNFTTNLVDSIMDVTQGRIEVREGARVEGKYWYSDGVEKRTVVYASDEDGYRIVSDTIEPLSEQPNYDPNGRVSVHTNIAGQDFSYSITADDIAHYKEDAGRKARV